MQASYAIAAILVWLPVICGGAWVASQKHRRPLEGMLLAFFFGPFGLVVEALLPALHPKKYRGGRIEIVPEYHEPAATYRDCQGEQVEEWLEP